MLKNQENIARGKIVLIFLTPSAGVKLWNMQSNTTLLLYSHLRCSSSWYSWAFSHIIFRTATINFNFCIYLFLFIYLFIYFFFFGGGGGGGGGAYDCHISRFRSITAISVLPTLLKARLEFLHGAQYVGTPQNVYEFITVKYAYFRSVLDHYTFSVFGGALQCYITFDRVTTRYDHKTMTSHTQNMQTFHIERRAGILS